MAAVVKRERDTSDTPEPEAKRPNVDAHVQVKSENNDNDTVSSPDSTSTTKKMASDASVKPEEKDAVDLGNVTADATPVSDNKADTSSISNGQEGDQVAGSAGSVGDASETQATQISMRTLIVTSDASIIIGKSGKHINEIRDKSNARLNIVSLPFAVPGTMAHRETVGTDNVFFLCRLQLFRHAQSEIIQGNPERILTVSGPLDAVSKVSRPALSNESLTMTR